MFYLYIMKFLYSYINVLSTYKGAIYLYINVLSAYIELYIHMFMFYLCIIIGYLYIQKKYHVRQ